MRPSLIAPTLVAMFLAVNGASSPADDPAQHRNPSDPPPTTDQAVPRPAKPRNDPDRPERRPERGPVVVHPGWPWWAYPSPDGYPPAPWRIYGQWQAAHVRIDVTPEDAQVYVDRFFAGVVDDFDGIFQRLRLRPGSHLIEIRKTGFTTLVFELNLYPGQTVTYRRRMERSSEPQTAAVPSAPPGFEEGAVPPVDLNVPAGEVRLDVTPKDAAVYADEFYAGLVSDFSGGQRLMLTPGRHHLTLELDGYEVMEVDLSVEPSRTITYRASLKQLR